MKKPVQYRMVLKRCEVGAHDECDGWWGDHLICTCDCHERK